MKIKKGLSATRLRQPFYFYRLSVRLVTGVV